MRRRTLIALALVAAGCGGGKKPAEEPGAAGAGGEQKPPVDREMLVEIAAGLEDVLATMAAITESTADCPAMAAQLEELFDKSAPLFDLARTQGTDPDAAPLLTAEMDTRAARVQPLVDRIGAGLGRCQMNADVARVIERMPTF